METYHIESSTDDFSFGRFFLRIKKLLLFFLKNKFFFILAALLGILFGSMYTIYKPLNYIAKLSFIVEEGKVSSGGLTGIAGQLGLDVGSLSGNGVTIFSGDNILLFFKSTDLCKQTLLTPLDTNISKSFSLADKYSDIYGLRKEWKQNLGKDIFFSSEKNFKSTREQDSLLQIIVKRILKSQLIVDRPEKKATFINVEFRCSDDSFAKIFCEKIVHSATERYVQIKTKRQKANVERLERRADSISKILYGKTFLNAAQLEKTLDLNPASRTFTVEAEVSNRDKLLLTSVYGEVIKNLEIAKITLNQETPVIQIIDSPELPLINNKSSIIVFAVLGMVVLITICTCILTLVYLIKNS